MNLAPYILAALLAWAHADRSTVPLETFSLWSNAMATSCATPEQCIGIAAVAYEETRFVGWAIDGSCNDRTWRRAHHMDRVCDGGHAVGPWQQHDPQLVGASPELQASVALERWKRSPQQWTTWEKAQKRAGVWLLRSKP